MVNLYYYKTWDFWSTLYDTILKVLQYDTKTVHLKYCVKWVTTCKKHKHDRLNIYNLNILIPTIATTNNIIKKMNARYILNTIKNVWIFHAKKWEDCENKHIKKYHRLVFSIRPFITLPPIIDIIIPSIDIG